LQTPLKLVEQLLPELFHKGILVVGLRSFQANSPKWNFYLDPVSQNIVNYDIPVPKPLFFRLGVSL